MNMEKEEIIKMMNDLSKGMSAPKNQISYYAVHPLAMPNLKDIPVKSTEPTPFATPIREMAVVLGHYGGKECPVAVPEGGFIPVYKDQPEKDFDKVYEVSGFDPFGGNLLNDLTAIKSERAEW